MAGRREIKIITGARLHFGLLRARSPFGGVGVMIDQPSGEIRITPSSQFRCDQIHRDRMLPIAQRVMEHAGVGASLPNCKITVAGTLAAHCGLGSGTQWSLAVAEGLCRFIDMEVDPTVLATQIAKRGKRSAVGVHGYFQGGLIHESSQALSNDPIDAVVLNPVIERTELPSSWRVVFMIPSGAAAQPHSSISGDRESDYFAALKGSDQLTQQLESELIQRLMPAAREGDFKRFGAALQDYNRCSGMLFAKVQGGPFNGPAVTSLISCLTDQGIVAVGQSSWGPGVFAWFETSQSATKFCNSLPPGTQILSHTKAKNTSRDLQSTIDA